MRDRVKVKAPWWTTLQGSERHATLEKVKDDGPGSTRYAVFVENEQVGIVYSVKDEKSTRWFAGDQLPDLSPGYADRFTAIRQLLNVRERDAKIPASA